MDPELRAAALEIARTLIDDPDSLNILAWTAVAKPGAPADQTAKAVTRARTALAILESISRPTLYSLTLDTLAVALYRNGDYEEAIEVATNLGELTRRQGAQPLVESRACLAMAHHHLGDRDRANAILEELVTRLKATDEDALTADAFSFIAEAEQVIGK